MITLAIENATLTGLVSTQSGTFLRSVCANREATPRWPLITFQSETCDWGFGPIKVKVSWPASSRYVQCQIFRRKDKANFNSPWPTSETGISGTGAAWKGPKVGSGAAKSSSMILWWSQYTYLRPSLHSRRRLLGQDTESQMQKRKKLQPYSTG